MRTRRGGSSRFCQLFTCCALLLILPTLLYLSSSPTGPKLVRDPRTGQWYTFDSLKGNDKDGALVPIGGNGVKPALSQGNGAEPAALPADAGAAAQGWRMPGSFGHLEDVLKDNWGSLKTGVGAWGHNAASALAELHHDFVGPAHRPPSSSSSPPSGGKAIADKLTNETLKAELGRATWKFLHTMTLRFPDTPTQDERDTLRHFFTSFARLYPCGDCATHFQALLEQYPPQTSSRMAASLWLCSVHNRVNERLGKPEFDCSKLDETYDCGCGGPKAGEQKGANTTPASPLLAGRSHSRAPEVFEGLGAGTGPLE